MYNEGHLWYVKTEGANLRQRLAAFNREKLMVYTVGCVTHAKEVLLAAADQNANNEYLSSAELLDAFWKDYPNSLSVSFIDALAERSEQVITRELGSEPDEHFLATPGAEPLLWGVLYALSCTRSPDSSTMAFDAIDKAYFSVFIRFGCPDGRFDANEMHLIESKTKECLDEIQFQLDYLNAIEGVDGEPLAYVLTLKQMSKRMPPGSP